MMDRQITRHIAMVRPCSFYFNADTAANDFFQKNLGEKRDIVEAKALIEFDGFVAKLRSKGINVHVIQDDASVFETPDSIFPNNWFVSLEGDKLVLRERVSLLLLAHAFFRKLFPHCCIVHAFAVV